MNNKNYTKMNKISLWVIFGSVLSMFYLIFEKGANGNDLSSNDRFVFAFAVASAFYGIYFAISSIQKSESLHIEAIHQAIGGYIPSKELNDLVKSHYVRCGGTLTPRMEFVSKWKDTEKLIPLLESHSFDLNVAKRKVVCNVKRNGIEKSATSASKEMALCIAFLKVCTVVVD